MHAQSQRVNISMLSLKWGDFLSTLPPGALALFAISAYFPALDSKIHNIDQISATFGLVLLLVAALFGELLGAFTRIIWERLWLVPQCSPPNALSRVTVENLDLYERGVQSSYKYVTFYANFAWAT